ncbi:MAG TPA: nucleotidyl transferase AbiEii/AbiGii toxin family protein, partial [bacterium]|nr:nucleotidyl transferase AbiEii/AbiGii toxin family protein [bacterium]
MKTAFDISKHRNVMLRILKDVYTHPLLGACLGFKGGTAAYLFYQLNRFSVDLDFDLLDPAKEDAVFSEMQNLLQQYGQLKDSAKKRFSLFFMLSYEGKVSNTQNVKIEVNRRASTSQYQLKSYLGISMLVMAQGDMAAHKLMAMSERLHKANRDIYDAWFFLHHGWPINRDIITQRAKQTYPAFIAKCV